jgi:hypothetical protein
MRYFSITPSSSSSTSTTTTTTTIEPAKKSRLHQITKYGSVGIGTYLALYVGTLGM